MSDKIKYIVKREHLGDKPYVTGDTRTLDRNEAKRLIALGVLAEPEAKADDQSAAKAIKAAPANKARKAAPENKAS